MNETAFEIKVNRKELFSQLAEMGGNFSPLGQHIVACLLGGEVRFSDAIGMKMYGVELKLRPSLDKPALQEEGK